MMLTESIRSWQTNFILRSRKNSIDRGTASEEWGYMQNRNKMETQTMMQFQSIDWKNIDNAFDHVHMPSLKNGWGWTIKPFFCFVFFFFVIYSVLKMFRGCWNLALGESPKRDLLVEGERMLQTKRKRTNQKTVEIPLSAWKPTA